MFWASFPIEIQQKTELDNVVYKFMLYAQHWLFFVGTRDLYVGWCFWLSLFLCVFAVWCFVNFCAESIWEVKIWAWSGKFWEGFPVVCAGEGYLWCALAQSICGFFILPCKSLQQRVCLAGLMLPFSVFACVHLSHIVQIMESRGSSSCLFMDSVWIWLSWKGKFKEAAVWWPSASCLQKIEGDRSNSVEVISGDKFNISSIYMLICCIMNTKYACHPYGVAFCSVSVLDGREAHTQWYKSSGIKGFFLLNYMFPSTSVMEFFFSFLLHHSSRSSFFFFFFLNFSRVFFLEIPS